MVRLAENPEGIFRLLISAAIVKKAESGRDW
jgi:hypothetical protein